MKRFFFLFAVAAFAFTFTMSSCGEDETPPVEIPPSIDFLTDDANAQNGPYPTSDFEVTDPDEFVYIGLEAVAGTADMTTLTIVDEDGNVATDRLVFYDLVTNADETVNNPLALFGDRINSFKFEIGIDPHDVIGPKTYTFQVADKNAQTNSISITITTIDPGTPIDTMLTGVLLNQVGPAGQGALDLDDGSSTGAVSGEFETAEIRDMGIDPAIDPAVQENWRRQIAAMEGNGAEMRVPGPTFPEMFSFEDVATKEEIQSYFEDGDALPQTIDGFAASDPVEIGDVFLVERDGRHYIIQVVDVRPTNPFPPNDNDDAIEFDIKY